MSSRLIGSLAATSELDELFSDAAVLGAMLRFEVALARSQARIGMIPSEAADAIERASVPADLDVAAIARDARGSASVAVPFVKALTASVERIDKRSAGFVHWGATSQDVIDTTLVLLLGGARRIFERDHRKLVAELRSLSEKHAKTVMLARSLLRAAPPTTFGYKAAGWLGGIERAWMRLENSFDAAMQIQFGGAAGTLAAYGDSGLRLAAELAKELGLAVPDAPWHTHRDRIAGVIADCGIYTGVLGKMARDIALLMQDEIGEVAEPGGGSSAMPDKRNPAASILAIAASVRVPGLVAAYLNGMAQEQERAAGGWQAEWPTVCEVIQATGSALAGMAGMIGGLTVNPERMRANIEATRGAVFAEKAAILLARTMGRTAAQALVAEAAKARTLRQGLAENPEAAARLATEEMEEIDRPECYLGGAEIFRRRLLGEGN